MNKSIQKEKADEFMNSKTLNFDDPLTYAGIFHDILYAKNVWPDLNNYFNDPRGKINELFSDPADINDHFLKKLQCDCETLFRKEYDYVTAYHACRTNDPEQFRRFGLLMASQERLEEKAREIFDGMGGLEKAISEAKSYFKAYAGSVHMYISAQFASIDYLDKGSMYLRKVAAKLGGEERLERQGKPAFVKCKLPLSWLRGSSPFGKHSWLHLYVAALMRRVIWAKASPNDKYEEFPETLAIFQTIPSGNIGPILNADVCDRWKENLIDE